MKKKLAIICLVCFVALTFILAACVPLGASSTDTMLYTPMFTASATLLPPYVETQQSAYVNSQLTQVAGEAQMQVLSLQGTQVALEMSQAAATSTAVQQQLDATATATAAIYQTQVAAVEQTAVAETQEASEKATQTQEAYIVGLTTITPAIATAQAIGRQTESDQQAQWFTTWAYRAAVVIIFIGALIALVFGARALWDARWAILARLGLVTWGPDGKPYWVAPYKGGVALLDMTRSLDPALLLSMDGELKTGGGASDKEMQMRLADHAQVIEHKLAEGTQAAQTKPQLPEDRRTVRTALPAASPQPALPSAPAPQIMVLASDDPRAKPWIEDAVRTVLSEGEIIDVQVRDALEYE